MIMDPWNSKSGGIYRGSENTISESDRSRQEMKSNDDSTNNNMFRELIQNAFSQHQHPRQYQIQQLTNESVLQRLSGSLPPPPAGQLSWAADQSQQIDQRLMDLLPHISGYGLPSVPQQNFQASGHLLRLAEQQQNHQRQQTPMFASPNVLDRIAFPFSSSTERPTPVQTGAQDRSKHNEAASPSKKGHDSSKLQIVSLSSKERKSGFPMPAVSGTGKIPKVGPLTKYRRIWNHLHRTAAKSSRVRVERFVPEKFATIVSRDKDTGHIYRKIHHLPGQDEIARPAKRTRFTNA